MGNVSVVLDNNGVPEFIGQRRVVRGVVTMSTSYASPGGDTIPTAYQKGGLTQLIRASVVDQGNNGYKLALDSRTAPTKVLAYQGAGAGAALGEVGNGTNLGTVKCEVEWEGY